MTKAESHKVRSKSLFRVGLPFCCLVLFPLPTAAQVYPISGVWAAIDPRYPKATSEVCLAVKTFGIEAVASDLIAELIIFDKDRKVDLRGSVQLETTIKSIKATDGGFRITETFGKGTRWLGFKGKASYFLTVIDPQTIEIRDAKTRIRYTRCGPHGRRI